MKRLNEIIQYCSDCRQKRKFKHVGSSEYKIILESFPESNLIETNRKIEVRKYSCNKCKSTINCGYTSL